MISDNFEILLCLIRDYTKRSKQKIWNQVQCYVIKNKKIGSKKAQNKGNNSFLIGRNLKVNVESKVKLIITNVKNFNEVFVEQSFSN